MEDGVDGVVVENGLGRLEQNISGLAAMALYTCRRGSIGTMKLMMSTCLPIVSRLEYNRLRSCVRVTPFDVIIF